ncbi:MAG TPA: BMP family ABC transporter substrate-binding protein, partial [Ilumatobacteraceae bacterium]|nr:BMP family ABC transporter substrate-binding protein [Ilumatobacteraceae bacterium]
SWGLVGAIGLIGTLTAVLLVAWVGQDSPPRVGLVAWTADNAFGANIAAGAERAEQEYDFQLDQVETLIDQHAQFREMAESHPDLIISDAGVVGSDVFADFPDINFGVIDGVVDAPNTQSILFANEQGAYLVGMAAALKSQTGIVGFVGAVPGNGATSFEDFRAGYEAGAKAVSPTITVLATYIEQPLVEGFTYFLNAFARQDLARERALELYSRGADVVFHAAGNAGFGVFRAAVDQSHALGRHLWAIGVDSDQWFQISDPETRDHLLTSMIKRADLASYLIIEDYLSGNFHPGVRTLQIADGALDYSTQGSGMTAAIRARLDQAKADIISGRIIVPTIPSGELLDLDPLPTGFADAVAQVGEEEFWVIVDESSLLYSAEWEEACWVSGTRATCAQFILERLRDAGVG